MTAGVAPNIAQGEAAEWPRQIRKSLDRPNNAHTTSFVYFILDSDRKLIKIGIAKDVEHRIAALQTASPTDLRIVGCLAGARDLERTIHELLAVDRVRGEWFRPSPRLLRLVADARTAGKRPGIAEPEKYRDALSGRRQELDPERVREYAKFLRISEATGDVRPSLSGLSL